MILEIVIYNKYILDMRIHENHYIKILYITVLITLTVAVLNGCDNREKSDNDSKIVVSEPSIEVIGISNSQDVPTIEVAKIDVETKEDTTAVDENENVETKEDATIVEEDDKESEYSLEEEVTDGEVSLSAENITINPDWTYASYSAISSGNAVMYRAVQNRRNIVIGVNAGHGTKGGTSVKTYCHPDMTPKVTGGTTSAGSIQAVAVSSGMSFSDGAGEAGVTLRMAQIFRDKLLAEGYDVLMVRDADDVQLDNVARTVMCNNMANCHIAIHWDGDGLAYDKGCFYISTPDGIKNMEPVASTWTKSEALGQALITGLSAEGCKINGKGSMAIDLTQTSYSTVPSVDIELGNQCSAHDDSTLSLLGDGLVAGVKAYFP